MSGQQDGPERFPIALDCDVLVGVWPPYADIDFGPDAVVHQLEQHGISAGLVGSARGAWFDDAAGNAELRRDCESRGRLSPTVTVNLRNALDAEQILDDAPGRSTVVRLFGALQGVPAVSPGYRHVVGLAAARGMTLLTDGDVREIWPVFADSGARVVFLDVHAYHVADFVLLARDHPGLIASTRLLNAPDSIERVVGEVGAGHLAYGSGTPLSATQSSALRLRLARITERERAIVAGGWFDEGTPS